MLDTLTESIAGGAELTSAQITDAVVELAGEDASTEAKADFLIALARRGETEGELAAFARELRERSIRPDLPAMVRALPLIDVCGTGGDQLNTFNISTAVAILLAACGVTVAKHGNRAITSKSGSADVLEALGIPIDLPPAQAARWLEAHQFAFLFAPNFHPAFRNIGPARKLCAQRGSRTLFNFLGPLLNPVQPATQLIGVSRRELCAPMASVLRALGARSARIVCGVTAAGHMDEVSLSGETHTAWFLNGAPVQSGVLNPETFGLSIAPVESLAGGDAAANAATIRGVLCGEAQGPKRDVVVLNAGVALHIAGVSATIQDGIEAAAKAIDGGAARAKLGELSEAGTEWRKRSA